MSDIKEKLSMEAFEIYVCRRMLTFPYSFSAPPLTSVTQLSDKCCSSSGSSSSRT